MKGTLKITVKSTGATKELKIDLYGQLEAEELQDMIEESNSKSSAITLKFKEDLSYPVDSIDEIRQEITSLLLSE